ncbi:hypothetical protein CVT25_012537 [Psilocybe cyanescens]|uniref:Uncharacterized protein n=1 Tax=Psilocybe cyanescens TaxID=93625 RepID=A0A409XFU5_PSICY|nr:hypothetical protein CVT25_012537 [Psilocybe cyanescens]
MSTLMQKFLPSADELSLASRLLETNTGSWNRSDTLSVDTAIGIFKQSGISFKQLREIWSIADRDGSGKLSKEELAVVIRLTGWVQAGKVLDESLLEKAGPLPKIKGIPDVVVPKVVPLFPPITSDDAVKLKETFLECNPVNGFLQKRRVMAALMDSKPDLSFEALFKVMQLVDTKNGLFDFKSFATSLHIVRSLHSSLISSVPLSVPTEDCTILDDVYFGDNDEGSDTIVQDRTFDLPAKVDSDIHDFMEDVKLHEYISGNMTLNFTSKYNINPTEMAQIWRQSDIGFKHNLSPARMTLFEQLIRKRVAKQISEPEPTSVAQSASAEPLPKKNSHSLDIVQVPSGQSDHSESPTVIAEPSATLLSAQSLPVKSPMHPTPNQPPSYDLSTLHEDFLPKFREEVGRLTSQLEVVIRDQRWTQSELRSNIDALRQENIQLKLQQQTLQDQLAIKEEACREAEKRVDSIKLDLLEQQVMSKEYQEAAININNEAERLWGTVETQSRQITTLLGLVADMKTTIMELNLKPEQHDLRVRFLRASVRESEAAATKAIGEAQELCRTVLDREQEIAKLLKRLEDIENVQPASQTNKDMQALRCDHETLKTRMENMQRLMEQHLMSPSAQTGTIGNADADVQRHETPIHAENSSLRKPSGSLHHIAIDLLKESNSTDSPPPFSSSPANQSLPKYEPRSSTPDLKVEPFYLSWDASTASTVTRSGPKGYIKMDDPSQHRRQLEDDLHLFKLHVQRKGYIGVEMVQRFISNYDLDAFSLDEIGRLTGLDASVKRINHAVDLIRQAVIRTRSYEHRLPSVSLSRSSTSTSISLNTISSNSVQVGDPMSSSFVDPRPPTTSCGPLLSPLPRHDDKLFSKGISPTSLLDHKSNTRLRSGLS